MAFPPIAATLLLGLTRGPARTLQQMGDTVIATGRFELQSSPRVALHHFLIDWATADAGRWPPYALSLAERDDWRSVLDPQEQRVWSAAVSAYAAAVGRSLVFDQDLVAMRDWAAGAAARDAVPAADRPLVEALEAALPIYRRHWWPAHDASNRAWIASVAPTLGVAEEEIIARLEAAYGGHWPQAPVPVDVVVYANDVGAYSAGGRLTISSVPRGNQMPQAIEMVFHESSHVDPLEQPLRDGLDDAFEAAGGEAPERFWHDMIFFTTGEVTRLVLAQHGQPGYQHDGSFGVYRRGERWAGELPALRRHWRPFLETASSDASARRAALAALAKALHEPR